MENRCFEMYTPAGDKACDKMVKSIEKKILGSKRLTKEEVLEIIKTKMKKVNTKHPEIHDTEPEYHITNYVNKALTEAGYGFEISRWEF